MKTKRGRLHVRVDGEDRTGGWSGHVAAGTEVRLVAPRHQVKNGVRWVFVRWSDGGARKHDLLVGDAGTTVTATYRRIR